MTPLIERTAQTSVRFVLLERADPDVPFIFNGKVIDASRLIIHDNSVLIVKENVIVDSFELTA